MESELSNAPVAEALHRLRITVAQRDALDALIAEQVRECRARGSSWNDIVQITGVSKPTAMKKWKDVSDMETSEPVLGQEWDIAEGDRLQRRDVHRRYGGNIQSGIAPSRRTSEILLFASARGELHGYSDGPNADGTYRYTGEGQRGDQQMIRGNRAILNHEADGKRLRLFEGSGDGWVTYVGEYKYDTHRVEAIPASGNGGHRQGIIFTLRKV